MPDSDRLENIRRTEADIRQASGQIKELREHLVEIVAESPAHQKLVKLAGDVERVKAELKADLEADKDYVATTEAVAELSFKLKDLKDILSNHLLDYRDNEKADHLEDEGTKKVRPIIVTAKTGKPQYLQEAMEFAEKVK